jgi:hypothetical protein
MRTRFIATLSIAFVILTGCNSVPIQEYKDTTPHFVPEKYFSTPRIAHGQFVDRSGLVRRQFTVAITGQWDEKSQTLTLNEDFVYNDGEKQTRIWTMHKRDEHRYDAKANDIPGVHLAQTYGQALQMRYAFPLKYNGKTINVTLDDWMWLQQDGEILINRSKMTKFGFALGEILISFAPQKM